MKRLLGLAFVVALAAAMTLSVLAYRKAFTPVTWVTLQADRIGLQLSEGADVKLRGVIVGEVREVATNGNGASLRLALDPDQPVPATVTARLLPKTLFGEKYVELVTSGGGRIVDGAVIQQDRSQAAVELERVLDSILPLLQAVKPDKLATTIGAIAYALDGRGERLGNDLATLNDLLKQLNTEMPTIAEDIRRLAEVATVYDGAAEDLLAILRDATVTATTITEQRAQLAGFLADTTDLATTTRIFLDRHDDRLIRLGQVTRPVLDLLATYSPEYPCLLRGVVDLQGPAEAVFASGRMHITLEITKDNGKYVPGRDEPVYGAHNGPNCRGLPNPGPPSPGFRVNDGYGGPAVGSLLAPMGFAGTAEEAGVIKPLVAASTGVPADRVPDVAVLLWGPLLRGAVVSTA
jgi:phospholipid/cholesterol/gamma-HCH transport system substrate-binding protein